MLSVDERLTVLRLSSFLVNAPPQLVHALAEHALERAYARGDFVYAKNDSANEFCVLVEGRIGHPEVQSAQEQFSLSPELTTPGQLFGFAALAPGAPKRVMSARCETAARVLSVNGQWFQRACVAEGPAGRELLQELVRAFAGHERAALHRAGWLSVRNVRKVYDPRGKATVAVDDVSVEIRPGEFCAIVGPPGSGKSTLASAIAGFDSITAGVVFLDGECINRPDATPNPGPERVAVVERGSLIESATVMENLIRRPIAQRNTTREAAAARARELLARIGAEGIESFLPPALSALACCQVEIIRAILNEPRVLVLDEPFRALDAPARKLAWTSLLSLHDAALRTTLFITEDIEEAIYLADRVLVMTARPASVSRTIHVALPRPRALDLLASARFLELAAEARQTTHDREPLAAPPVIATDEAEHRPREIQSISSTAIEPVARERIEPRTPPRNALREALDGRRFFWTIEFIPSVDKVLRDELQKLGGVAAVVRALDLLAGFSVTDRVVSDRDPDPVAAAAHLLDVSGKQPIVHFSGKGRETDELHAFLERMRRNGLTNLLALTGDRLKDEPTDRRPRYLESVAAIALARQAQPDLLIAAAVNPFKYREEDAMAQYLKLGKKVAAGVDFVITQIGYDMLKYEEAVFWVDTRDYRVPIVANVMPISAVRARYIRKRQLAGVTITDSYLALLEAEEKIFADKGATRVLRRLALQILGLRQYGYAGVQLTGIHAPEKLAALGAHIRELSELCSDRMTWNKAWLESLTLPEGGSANPAPRNPWYLVNERKSRPRRVETLKYRAMKEIHSRVFDRGPIAAMLGAVLRPILRHSTADRVLERIERSVKAPLFGCETCGTCRLALTQYVCPETCPKGLADGACGGTTENLCEFRDRECIHSKKYRIAHALMRLPELESTLIAPVPKDARHTSSWPPYFRGERPVIAPASPADALAEKGKRG